MEVGGEIHLDIRRIARSLRDLKAYMDATRDMTLPQIAASEKIELRFTDLPGDMLSDAGTLVLTGGYCIMLDHSLSEQDQRKYFIEEMVAIISNRNTSYILNGTQTTPVR
jgi:hypothetical protein